MISETMSLQLFLVVAIWLGLFAIVIYGYCKLAKIFLSESFASLPWGFVYFVATSHIIALPFMLFRGSINGFFWMWALVQLTVLLVSLTHLSKTRWMNYKPKPSLVGLLVLATSLAVITLSVVVSRYNADDAFYVSAINQATDSSSLVFDHDPATGLTNVPYQARRSLESWELVLGSISRITGIQAATVAHLFVPLATIPVAILSFRDLYSFIKTKKLASMSLLFTLVLFVYGGNTARSASTFLLSRPWQAKALIASLVVAMLYYCFIKILQKPNGWKPYLALMLLSLAATSMNPTGMIIVGVSIVSFSPILLWKTREPQHIIRLVLATTPLFASAALLYYLETNSVSSSNAFSSVIPGRAPYLPNFEFVFDNSLHIFLALVLTPILFLVKELRPYRNVLIGVPAVLLLSFLNPLVISFVQKFVTSAAYWRMFWIIPFVPVVAISMSYLADRLISRSRDKLGAMTATLLVVSVIIGLSGHMTFVFANGFKADLTATKSPPGVVEIVEVIDESFSESQLVLGERNIARYLRNYTVDHKLIISRKLYLRHQFDRYSQDYKEHVDMYNFINNLNPDVIPSVDEFIGLVNKYGIDLVVVRNSSDPLRLMLIHSKFDHIYTGERYSILSTNPSIE